MNKEIYIYLFDISYISYDYKLGFYLKYMDNYELKHINNMGNSLDKFRTSFAHYFVKYIYHKYYGKPLTDIKMSYGIKGKPFIRNSQHFHFNISHSYYKIMICFASFPLGCDIEKIADYDQAIANLTFSSEELHSLQQTQTDQQSKLMYKYWTCKEAVTKLLGLGFYLDPKSFSVIDTDNPIQLKNKKIFFKSFCSDNFKISISSYHDNMSFHVINT